MDATLTKVFIWDMDETLILLKSLLNGTFAQSFNDLKDADKGVQLGRMWENHILNVCDECFFYEQIENNNTPFLDALKQYDDGRDLSDYEFDRDGLCPPFDDLSLKKIAYRHRAIAHKYKEGLQNIFDKEMLRVWDELYDMTDEYTDRWLSSARVLLEQCSSGKEVSTSSLGLASLDSADTKSEHRVESLNLLHHSLVIFSSNPEDADLRRALTVIISPKNAFHSLLAFGQNITFRSFPNRQCLLMYFYSRVWFVPRQHVTGIGGYESKIGFISGSDMVKCNSFVFASCVLYHCSWEVGKLQCFQWIKERFNNPNVQFCVIGDGWEEGEAAQAMQWPFVKIDLGPGSCHRFPGLSLRTLGCYLSVVYGSPSDETDEE
ncbi:Eyes absent-like [Citrus sinensis]|uniref:Eyes absent-like n=1 Tax=Citrus sinensis TaxID=2711 RepID=A0ACB8L8N4_CITSI|nr:Eyes absent-like [Citrus sinensis]